MLNWCTQKCKVCPTMNDSIIDVRNVLTPELKQEIIQFWVSEGALQPPQAQARVSQVLQIIRQQGPEDQLGAIMGICTAELLFVEHMQISFFNYRSYIGQNYRSMGLVKALLASSYLLLNQDYASGKQTEALGLLLDIENPLLKQRKGAVWGNYKFTFIGLSPKGNHIRVAYFENAQLP